MDYEDFILASLHHEFHPCIEWELPPLVYRSINGKIRAYPRALVKKKKVENNVKYKIKLYL